MLKVLQKWFRENADPRTWAIMLVGLIFCLIWMWLGLAGRVEDVKFDNEDAQLLSTGWQVASGGLVQDAILPGKVEAKAGDIVELTRVLDAESISGNSLIFYVRQSWVEVYLGEEQLLESAQGRKLPFDMVPGSYWYFFRLPSDFEGKTLKIVLNAAVDRYAGELPPIYVGTKASFLYMVLSNSKLSLMLVLPMLILGICLWIMGLFPGHQLMRRKLCRLGMFATVTSVWSLLESRVTQMLFGNMVLSTYVLFSCYMLIPFFAAAFLLTFETLGKRKYIRGLFWLSGANFVLAHILQIAGVTHYIDMVSVVHVLIILVMLSVWVSYIDLRRHRANIPDKSIYRAMMILSVFCILDIVNYYIKPTNIVGSYSKVGLLLFFGYLGLSVIRQISKLEVQEAENRLIQKLAYTDMMTGLLNRTSFEKEMADYREKPWKEITILMVGDMNRLKYINDNYGHAQGDKALIQIAYLMQQCFGDGCKCFRTGGDEFCVISRGISEKKFAALCKRFMRSVMESPQEADWQLSVSCGYCVADEGGIDECYRRADAIMYAEKVASKQQRRS